ncbi:MAG: hypothetical protein K9M80_07635 [Candidatus Marinimicrobia bacterium]|nr:hypothetical protein [Candidatus Neomarinimicrobiota bacterium]
MQKSITIFSDPKKSIGHICINGKMEDLKHLQEISKKSINRKILKEIQIENKNSEVSTQF